MIHATKNKTATIGENVCFDNFISCEILKTNKKKTKVKELLEENYSRPGSYRPSISFMVNANTLEIVCTMF